MVKIYMNLARQCIVDGLMSGQCIVDGLMSRQCIVDGLMSRQCIVDGLMSRQCIVDGLMSGGTFMHIQDKNTFNNYISNKHRNKRMMVQRGTTTFDCHGN